MVKLKKRSRAEPFDIKTVDLLKLTTRVDRARALKESGYNTFLLKSEDVCIDLVTVSGTYATSDYRWAGMMLGDEAYTGSKTFCNLEARVRQFYG